MIVQDKQEDQVKAIVYGDDIPAYQKRMKLYRTYCITGGRVQPPYLKNEKPVHTFNWILDRKSIIDKVKKHSVDALPPPTKLNTTSFQDIKHHVLQTTTDTSINEFDILAIVICFKCGKRIQELIVMSISKETLTFTISEEGIIEQEGISLTTKFNTTIQIDPPYPQCRELQKWIIENQEMLVSFTRRSTSRSGFFISIPVDEEMIPIAKIESQQDGQIFSLEARISCSTNLRNLYVLVCSNCGQEVRYPTIREIHCMNCDQKNMLLPRCKFEIYLEDNSGSTVGMIIDKEAEKLLSLTAAQIYEKTSHLDKDMHMEEIGANFHNKIFSIRAKKAFAYISRTTSVKIYIQSCVEKENFTHSIPSPSLVSIQERTKRKQQIELPQLAEETASLKMKQKVQPDTPPKTN